MFIFLCCGPRAWNKSDDDNDDDEVDDADENH